MSTASIDEGMGSGDEVASASAKERVVQAMQTSGLQGLFEELLRIQQEPNGKELLARICRPGACYEPNLLHLACDLDGIPLLGCFAVGGPRPRRYSRDEFSRAFAECQALALEVARFLVDEVGADVNYEFDHETPLSSTVKRGCEPIAKLLLERGADNRSRVQALFWAADFADDSMLKLLLENGADVVDTDGSTALTDAARTGRFLLVERLMAAGIDIHRPDASGDTAAQVAWDAYRDDIVALLTEEVRLLLLGGPGESIVSSCFVLDANRTSSA
jgi:hypothetical protein